MAAKLTDAFAHGRYSYLYHYEGDVERLAELVLALDEWLTKGGFLPAAWKKEKP